jgi:hypothetical protein
MRDPAVENPQKLRELAAWYREYAERASAPWVREGRLRTAACLEHQAAMLENTRRLAGGRSPVRPSADAFTMP